MSSMPAPSLDDSSAEHPLTSPPRSFTPPPSAAYHLLTGQSTPPNTLPNTPAADLNLALENVVGRGRGGRKSPTQVVGTSLNVPIQLDYRAITYVGPVDENLACPICHCTLVDPITTDCDHTFCRTCIQDSLQEKEICPADRIKMSRETRLKPAPRIIINQLDNLKVKCPCCQAAFARSMLKNHMEKYCQESLIWCPGKNNENPCKELVKRKLSDKGCLHFYTTCPDCQVIVWQIQLEEHRELTCKKRHSKCDRCKTEILLCQAPEHEQQCLEIVVSCQWAEYGCQHEAKRKNLQFHNDECSFKLVGPMAEVLRKEIKVLQTEVHCLNETNRLQERRIKFLEKGSRESDRMIDYSDLPTQQLTTLPESESANSDPLDSAHEYLLSLLEAQESKVARISADMTDLDSKQTVMLFNETLPIKNELAEMRSNLQVTSMHVRWLMRFRIQENQRRGYAGGSGMGGGPSGSDGGSGGDSPLPTRRLSDSMREIITKL